MMQWFMMQSSDINGNIQTNATFMVLCQSLFFSVVEFSCEIPVDVIRY